MLSTYGAQLPRRDGRLGFVGLSSVPRVAQRPGALSAVAVALVQVACAAVPALRRMSARQKPAATPRMVFEYI